MWLSWGHFGIILSFILASTSHHVTLCILLMPCCAVDVILELLSGYFAVVLASCCALWLRPDAIPWPLCAILPPCYVVGIHFGGVVWLSWGRFDIILSFILASTSHHVTLCILLMPCCAVDVILELLSGYFAVVLASCCALCSRPDAILWPICTIVLPCCAVGIHFGGIVWLSWGRFGIILSFIEWASARVPPTPSSLAFEALTTEGSGLSAWSKLPRSVLGI